MRAKPIKKKVKPVIEVWKNRGQFFCRIDGEPSRITKRTFDQLLKDGAILRGSNGK